MGLAVPGRSALGWWERVRLWGRGPGEEGAGTTLEGTPRKVQLLLPASSGCRGLLRVALEVCKGVGGRSCRAAQPRLCVI